MDSNSKTGNANGPHKLSLKLRERQKSLERQSTARGFSVTEHCEASTTTTKPTVLDTSTLDDHLKEVLKRLVHRLIDSENAFYALGDRIKKLETSVLDETCPKGLTIKPVKATGKDHSSCNGVWRYFEWRPNTHHRSNHQRPKRPRNGSK